MRGSQAPEPSLVSRKLKSAAEPGLEPRPSNMECGHPKWYLDSCLKCPLIGHLMNECIACTFLWGAHVNDLLRPFAFPSPDM